MREEVRQLEIGMEKDGERDRQTDRQTDGRTDRPKEKVTKTERDGETQE